jgi:phosphoribosyl-ATP pyrophosphohydrolase
MTIDDIYKVIIDRKKNMPKDSYVASLFRDGEDRIIQKVGEEATEVVISAKNGEKERIIAEVADLQFHVLVLLANFNISFDEVVEELQKRNKK